MAENPWYPFYIGDYQQKTAALTLLEHGAYRLLLDHYYATKHALPADRKIIYRICRAVERKERQAVNHVLDLFFTVFDTEIVPNPDRVWIQTVSTSGKFYVHEKCELEISKQLNFSKSQSAKAQIRHSKGHMPETMPVTCPRARLPQPQPYKKVVIRDKSLITYTSDFLEVWESYPRKDGSKAKAFLYYQQAIKGGVDHGTIIGAARSFAKEVAGKETQYIPHAATWLNQRRWETVGGAGSDPAAGNAAAVAVNTEEPRPGDRERPGKRSRWDVEADRLLAKYDEQAQRERQEAADAGVE